MQNPDNFIPTKECFLIVLDSRNATEFNNGDYKSDVTFDLNDAIRFSPSTISMSIVVLSFTCPVSFYQINNTNCTLHITLDSIVNTINIPYGNYNVNTFITYLLSVLPSDFTITVNQVNNILTINSITTSFQINSNSTIYNVMGFFKNKTYPAQVVSTGYQLVMPYTVNFAGINSFNIAIENIRTKNIDSLDLSVSSIIASIPVNSSQGGVIYYEKKNDFEIAVRENIIDYLDVNIKDDMGNLLNFNNQSWNLVLQFNQINDLPRFKSTFHEELTSSYYRTNKIV
jgi:hypothetical protein